MKIRCSFKAALMGAPAGFIAALPLPLVQPGLGYGSAGFWAVAALLTAAVALIGVAMIPFGIVKVEGPRLYVRGKYGWNLKHELAEGERLDFGRGRLRVRSADGALVGPAYLVKWMALRRDWDRLEAAYGDRPGAEAPGPAAAQRLP